MSSTFKGPRGSVTLAHEPTFGSQHDCQRTGGTNPNIPLVSKFCAPQSEPHGYRGMEGTDTTSRYLHKRHSMVGSLTTLPSTSQYCKDRHSLANPPVNVTVWWALTASRDSRKRHSIPGSLTTLPQDCVRHRRRSRAACGPVRAA